MKHRGFTLIEIIVSVALLLLLSGLFIANYTGFNSSQTVKQAASSLVRNFQGVRTRAASGAKPTGCDTLVGYTVKFPDSSTYTSQASCSNGDVGDITTYPLPASVTFSPTPLPVTFYALDRGASTDQTIILTGFGTTATVVVATSGVVQ